MMKKQRTNLSKKPTLLFLTFLLAVSILVMQKGTLSLAAAVYDVPAGTTSLNTDDIPEDAETINIPASVTKIPSDVYGRSNLKAINVDSNNNKYASVDGVLYNKRKTELISYPRAKTDKTYTMPKTVKKLSKVEFMSRNKYIEKVVMSDQITVLPVYSFYGCSKLKSVHLPKKLKEIDTNAFGGCPKLKSLTIPASCTSACLPDDCKTLKTLKINSKKLMLQTCYGSDMPGTIQIKKGASLVLDIADDGVVMKCKPSNIISIKPVKIKRGKGKNSYSINTNQITAKKTGTATVYLSNGSKLVKIKVVK